jgi:hypothetical protein
MCACNGTLTIHGAPAASAVPATFTLGAGESFTVVLQTSPDVPATTYTVHYSPQALPPYTVTTIDPTQAGSEPVMLTPGNYILIADRSGAPMYYRNFSPLLTANFRRYTLPGGEIAYSTFVGTSQGGVSFGVAHTMNEQFQDTGDFQLLANRAHGALPAEAHDFLLLGDQHYVAETYVQRTVDLSALNPAWSAQSNVLNVIVQEVDHGTVVLEWDSGDVPSLYTDSVDGNAFSSTAVSDYLHLNTIAIDPSDQNFIFSLRHLNAISKVDRTSGQILWMLGGKEDSFGLTPAQAFYHQHDAHFEADGSLVVFDNGNNGPGQPTHQTQVLAFTLDEANKKVTAFEVVYPKPADQPPTTFMGAATRLDSSRYLIGWGGWTGGSVQAAATEVVAGAPVWTLTFTTAGTFSYRAFPVLSE